MRQLQYHPLAGTFPLMGEAEYDALKEDIRAHGLREPILLAEGKIIDGRNRYRACLELGIRPSFHKWDGQGNLVSLVVSLNLHRRHLSESQRAMVAARLANVSRGGDRRSDQAVKRRFDHVTQGASAQALNVSPKSVERAKRVLDRGTAGLIAATEADLIPVSLASQVAERDEDFQRDVVERVKSGKAKHPATAYRQVREERSPFDSMPRHLLDRDVAVTGGFTWTLGELHRQLYEVMPRRDWPRLLRHRDQSELRLQLRMVREVREALDDLETFLAVEAAARDGES